MGAGHFGRRRLFYFALLAAGGEEEEAGEECLGGGGRRVLPLLLLSLLTLKFQSSTQRRTPRSGPSLRLPRSGCFSFFLRMRGFEGGLSAG